MKPSVRFDFNEAVADAKRDYPEQTANITFIDLASPHALQDIKNWFEERKEEVAPDFFKKSLEDMLKAKRGKSLVPSFSDKKTGALLVIDTREDGEGLFNLRFVFNHELGHILTNFMGDTLLKEQQADCFAILRGLKEGSLHQKDINKIKRRRFIGAIALNDRHHDTAAMIKRLKKDIPSLDISSQSNERIRKMAENYPLLAI
jgi:hypothetical protein